MQSGTPGWQDIKNASKKWDELGQGNGSIWEELLVCLREDNLLEILHGEGYHEELQFRVVLDIGPRMVGPFPLWLLVSCHGPLTEAWFGPGAFLKQNSLGNAHVLLDRLSVKVDGDALHV